MGPVRTPQMDSEKLFQHTTPLETYVERIYDKRLVSASVLSQPFVLPCGQAHYIGVEGSLHEPIANEVVNIAKKKFNVDIEFVSARLEYSQHVGFCHDWYLFGYCCAGMRMFSSSSPETLLMKTENSCDSSCNAI